MTDDEINERIYRLQGFEKLPWPALPTWQKPGKQLLIEPKYSTNPQAVLDLIEEARAAGLDFYIESSKTGRSKWWSDFTDAEDRWHVGEADTFCRAVCMAYIQFKRGEE